MNYSQRRVGNVQPVEVSNSIILKVVDPMLETSWGRLQTRKGPHSREGFGAEGYAATLATGHGIHGDIVGIIIGITLW